MRRRIPRRLSETPPDRDSHTRASLGGVSPRVIGRVSANRTRPPVAKAAGGADTMTIMDAEGQIAEDPSFNDLVHTLSHAESDSDRALAAAALGRAGGHRVADALVLALREQRSATVSQAVADALVVVGEPAVPGLMDLLTTGDPAARSYAARILEVIGGTVARPAAEVSARQHETASDAAHKGRTSAITLLVLMGVGLGADAAVAVVRIAISPHGIIGDYWSPRSDIVGVALPCLVFALAATAVPALGLLLNQRVNRAIADRRRIGWRGWLSAILAAAVLLAFWSVRFLPHIVAGWSNGLTLLRAALVAVTPAGFAVLIACTLMLRAKPGSATGWAAPARGSTLRAYCVTWAVLMVPVYAAIFLSLVLYESMD